MSKWLFKTDHQQTAIEEIANSLTHGIGALLSIAVLTMMIVLSAQQHNTMKVIGSVVFGVTLVILYSSSTIYHAITNQQFKLVCRVIDHISIYLLIAGTYTPIVLVILPVGWGWSLFGIVWGLAIFGTIFKLFFTGRFEVLSVLIYLAMGWVAIVAIDPIWHALPAAGLLWIAAGGFCYTAGVAFYTLDRVRFAHTLWHLFVLAGSACHVIFVMKFVIG